jgi:hypothetical protein
VTAIIPAPTYVLARAAWIPTLAIWHADGRFTRLVRAACADYAAANVRVWQPMSRWWGPADGADAAGGC